MWTLDCFRVFVTPDLAAQNWKEREMSEQKSRREILRKTAYVVPTVITLAVKPSFASTGSGQYDGQNDLERRRGGEWEDHSNSRHERESKKPKKNGKKH